MFLAGMAGDSSQIATESCDKFNMCVVSILAVSSFQCFWGIFVGLPGLEKLRDSRPEAVERPGAVAGLVESLESLELEASIWMTFWPIVALQAFPLESTLLSAQLAFSLSNKAFKGSKGSKGIGLV